MGRLDVHGDPSWRHHVGVAVDFNIYTVNFLPTRIGACAM
jgi:hypothetical protein